jgi:hypothetical protein
MNNYGQLLPVLIELSGFALPETSDDVVNSPSIRHEGLVQQLNISEKWFAAKRLSWTQEYCPTIFL